MLYLIGLGLTPKQLTMEALHAIQVCSTVYVENYTSKYSEGKIEQLETMIGKKITLLNREKVENDSADIVEKAKGEAVGLLVFGNPLTATTHHGLLQSCVEARVKYHVIPGISVFNYRGFSGLDEYRFGRTTTFVFPEEGYEPLSTFDIIVQNKKNGLHTHCLFDLHPEKKRFMTILEGIDFLERAGKAREVATTLWHIVGMAGLGGEHQQLVSGRPHELRKIVWNGYPQSMIVCGELTPYEKESLSSLSGGKKNE